MGLTHRCNSMEYEYIEMNPPGKKRSYNSSNRIEKARATAREIARAAQVLFERDGYPGVTMKDIARAAGVAPATVYLHFPGKASIVEALARAITDDPDLSVEQVEGEASAVEQLRLGASILHRLNERSWLVVEILRNHAGAEPELEALRVEWQRRHLDAVTRGVAAIASAGQLRPHLSVAEAADILYAVGGTDLYRALVRERGWPGGRYESWLAEFATEHLIARDEHAGE